MVCRTERRRSRAILVVILLGLVGSCGDDGAVQPPGLRFGQSGEIRVSVLSGLAAGRGELQQVLNWRSDGAWRIVEKISYRGLSGGEAGRESTGDPSAYAVAYASLITQIHEQPGLELFIPGLDPALDPECSPGTSRVTFQLRDEARNEEVRWTRCGVGSLGFLSALGAGPDAAASRVVQAAILARDFTLGESFESAYLGSLPFGSLERGEGSNADLERSLAFHPTPEPGTGVLPASSWPAFWQEHKGMPTAPPSVDWEKEMVLVGAVGTRFEAGDSVEIRRVLQVTDGAMVEIVERVPGDFCAPAERTQIPYHIVVVPLTPPTIRFLQPEVQRVPCGT